MARLRRFPKASSGFSKRFPILLFFCLSSGLLWAESDLSWVQKLWVEHLEALDEKGVPVNHYREKTLRLQLMVAPNDLNALGRLMRFHAQRKSKLAAVIAHHILSLESETVDRNLLELAQTHKASWDEALTQKSKKPISYYEFTWPKIEQAFKQGKYVEAEQLLLEMLWDYPGDEKSLRYLAQLFLFHHEWRLADVVYTTLQAQGLEDVEILNNRALLLVKLSGVEAGVQAMEDLEQRYPTEAAIIQNRAVLAEQRGNHDHELILAGKWAQLDRKNPEALKHYGQKLLDSKNWIFARDAFTRAIRLRPETNDHGAMWGLAQAEAGLGEYKKSARIIQDIKDVASDEQFTYDLSEATLPEEIRNKFVGEGS